MTEAAAIQTDPPAKKPARKKKAKRVATPKAANPFAGLTKNDCASGCNADGCVISGKPYCAHPAKGGLQATDLGNRETTERLNQAVKYLKRKALG